METERYKKNKKFPTNEDIVDFFKRYGLICSIIMIVLLIASTQVSSIITRTIECGNAEWDLTNYENNRIIFYENDSYRITDINVYKALEKITIHLEKK